MSITIKKYNLTNCTSNITDSSIELNTNIIVTADKGFFFQKTPSYALYNASGYSVMANFDFDKIDDFNYTKTFTEYNERIISINANAYPVIALIYELNHCYKVGLDYTGTNQDIEIILNASEGYIFKDAPYCIDSEISNTEKIYFEKITDYEYHLYLSAEYLSDSRVHITYGGKFYTNPIYIYGATIENIGDFEESKINDNINYGFINIYKPTVEELQIIANGAFIDMSNIHNVTYDDISKYIYSLRKVYFKIPEYGKENIYIADCDTKVQSEVIKDEIINAYCGNISVEEYYGNVFDYEGFTTAKIYLPFIGFKTLDINNIMNSKLYLYYRLNIITGKIVTILKTDKRGKIYTFDGQGGFDILYTMNLYQSFVNKSANYDVQYMAGLTPYLQLFTKNPYNAEYNPYGHKVSEWKKLNTVNGYVECEEIQFMPIHEYIHYDEMQEIKKLCKEGIFL